MAERRVTFFSQSLGIKLQRGADGKVRVIEVKPNSPDHQGEIYVGDVLCEVQGIVDLRDRPISNQLWGDVIRTIKVAPRPLVFVMGADFPPAGSSGDVGVECEFDPFGLHHANSSGGNENVDSNQQNHHRRMLTGATSKKSGGTATTKGSKSNSSSVVRRTRSLTPPRNIIPSLFGRKDSNGTNSAAMKNSSNGGSTNKNSAQATVAKNFQKATACLIPQELRELSGGGGGSNQPYLQEYDTRGLHDSVNSSNWETQIECKDFQQMLLVSNISLDDELLDFQEEENARYDSGAAYSQQGSGATANRRYYQEEHKEDPPSHQPYLGARKKTTVRRTSF